MAIEQDIIAARARRKAEKAEKNKTPKPKKESKKVSKKKAKAVIEKPLSKAQKAKAVQNAKKLAAKEKAKKVAVAKKEKAAKKKAIEKSKKLVAKEKAKTAKRIAAAKRKIKIASGHLNELKKSFASLSKSMKGITKLITQHGKILKALNKKESVEYAKQFKVGVQMEGLETKIAELKKVK